MSSAVATASYSRVTVVGPGRRADLALPTGTPLADLLPQLLRLLAVPGEPTDPRSWAIAPLGGTALRLDTALMDSTVLDGDVLELRPVQAQVRAAYVEDVRDAVEDEVDAAEMLWTPTTTRQFALWLIFGVSAAALGLGATTAGLSGGGIPAGSAGLAVVLALVAGLAGRWGFPRAAHALTADACAWGFAAAALFVTAHGGVQPPAALTWWAVGTAAPTAIASVLTRRARGYLVAAVVASVFFGIWWVASLFKVSSVIAGPCLAMLGILLIGAVPRVALAVGGLAAADYRVRAAGTLSIVQLRRRMTDSSTIVAGCLAGIGVVVAVVAIVAGAEGGLWPTVFAVALSVELMLRSRAFGQRAHLIPLRVSGAVALLGVAYRGLTVPGEFAADNRPLVVLGGVLLVVLVVLALAAARPGDVARARIRRGLNITEMLLMIGLVVLLAQVTGLLPEITGANG